MRRDLEGDVGLKAVVRDRSGISFFGFAAALNMGKILGKDIVKMGAVKYNKVQFLIFRCTKSCWRREGSGIDVGRERSRCFRWKRN
ncbi:MAG: hypothetical protein J6Z35_06340 [Lachnospiraceae bacterium]|nr:hypothetical protein [Lachnospiraceae bacterium]